jgi:hypothetical protein
MTEPNGRIVVTGRNNDGRVLGNPRDGIVEQGDRFHRRDSPVKNIPGNYDAVNRFCDDGLLDLGHNLSLCLTQIHTVQRPAEVPVTGVKNAHIQKLDVPSDISEFPRRNVVV